MAWAEPGAVEGAAGVGEVQIRMESPSRSDWVVATRTASGEYKARISLDLADALFGSTLGFDVEVRAWDINENYREFQGHMDGAAVAVLNWVLDTAADTWEAVVDAVMSVINAIVDWIKEQVQWLIDNIFQPAINLVESVVDTLYSLWLTFINKVNEFDDSGRSSHSDVDDTISAGLGIFNIFGGLLNSVKPVVSAIMNIIQLIEPFTMLFDLGALVMQMISILGSSFPAIGSLIGDITKQGLYFVLDRIMGKDNSLFSLLNVGTASVSSDDFSEFPIGNSLNNFLIAASLSSTTSDIMNDWLSDNLYDDPAKIFSASFGLMVARFGSAIAKAGGVKLLLDYGSEKKGWKPDKEGAQEFRMTLVPALLIGGLFATFNFFYTMNYITNLDGTEDPDERKAFLRKSIWLSAVALGSGVWVAGKFIINKGWELLTGYETGFLFLGLVFTSISSARLIEECIILYT